MTGIVRLDMARAQLLVVDIQEKLTPLIAEHERVVRQSVRMIQAAKVMDLHISVSEQYTAGLGHTVAPIREALGPNPDVYEKMTFSTLGSNAARKHLTAEMRQHVLLVGIETHVCVMQTAFDLLEAQMQPVVLADAVGSRNPEDRRVALDRMARAGVVVTTVESAIFEMLEKAGTELFKRILPILK